MLTSGTSKNQISFWELEISKWLSAHTNVTFLIVDILRVNARLIHECLHFNAQNSVLFKILYGERADIEFLSITIWKLYVDVVIVSLFLGFDKIV